jgi:2-(1,2-epoxy-1,2-dihydrophenyl)acetyl-CoA isomerase
LADSTVTDVGADGAVRASRDGDVLRLTLDRPSRRNALNHSMIDALVDLLTDAATDDSLRAIHIRGAGSDFCTGADWVAANNTGQRPRAGDLVRRIPHTANRLIELIHTVQLPVVCSVKGWAVGLGCNLAVAADFTVAADDSVFWEPFVGRGFSPDSGSTWLLPRLIGLARAKEMLLLGEKVNGADAADWGLIHRSVATTEVDDVAEQLVTRLASGPTVAIGLAKQAINYGQHATLGQAMMQELFNVELSCRTTDFKEGLAAFRDKRTPEFGGR